MSAWDAIEIGARRDLGSHRFTAEAIKAFAAAYDPQVFHLDEEAAKASLLGGLCASGWHTAAVFMRLNVEDMTRFAGSLAASDIAAPAIGPSPGFRNMRWPRPVYAGDTIRYFSTTTAKRPSASRPGWGIVESQNLGINEAGETVFGFDGAGFIGLA